MRCIKQKTPNEGESVGELPWQTVCISLPAGPDAKVCGLSTRYTEKLFTAFRFFFLKKKRAGGHSKKYSRKQKNTSTQFTSLSSA